MAKRTGSARTVGTKKKRAWGEEQWKRSGCRDQSPRQFATSLLRPCISRRALPPSAFRSASQVSRANLQVRYAEGTLDLADLSAGLTLGELREAIEATTKAALHALSFRTPDGRTLSLLANGAPALLMSADVVLRDLGLESGELLNATLGKAKAGGRKRKKGAEHGEADV